MKVGLVIAKDENDLSELKKYILDFSDIDLFLFPEGYLRIDQLNEASKIVAKAGKWLITSYSDDSSKQKFEMYFPEIVREYKLQGARVVFNPIGTGMYHEKQYEIWSSLGRIRAYENNVYTFGCVIPAMTTIKSIKMKKIENNHLMLLMRPFINYLIVHKDYPETKHLFST